jgi:alpha/beta superfamily hydrolase
MNEIKTLADQLRSRMAKPDTPDNNLKPEKKKRAKPPDIPAIVEQLRTLDVSANKTLIHARVDTQTAQLIHHLKTATGIEVTRLICFSIRHFFEAYPELKTLIKEHLEKFEL